MSPIRQRSGVVLANCQMYGEFAHKTFQTKAPIFLKITSLKCRVAQITNSPSILDRRKKQRLVATANSILTSEDGAED